MKWRVQIPRPSAKRMAGTGKLFIQVSDGWCAHRPEQLFFAADHTAVEFEVGDDYEWFGARTMMDGPNFSVWLEYNNSTGSRHEKVTLVPEKVE